MMIRSKQLLLSVKSVAWITSNLLLWIAYCSISFPEGSDTIIIHLDQVTTVISNETTTIENYIVQQQQDTDEQLLFGNDSIKSYNLYCDIGGNLKDDADIESNDNYNNIIIQDKEFHDGVTVKKTLQKQQQGESLTHNDVGNKANDNDEFVCRLYLAESTIPHAGLGVFSGIPYAEKDTLPLTGDIIIPLAHLEDVTLIHEYTWTGDLLDHVFALGMGAIPNCFFGLQNVDASYPGSRVGIRFGNIISNNDDNINSNSNNKASSYIREDYSNPSFSYNPNIGASTIYYSTGGGITKRDIKIGEEIFIDYGESYFESRQEDKFGLIPFKDDYEVADKLLHRFRNVANRVSDRIVLDNCKEDNVLTHDDKFWMIVEHSRMRFHTKDEAEKKSTSMDIATNKIAFDLYELTKTVLVTWPTRVTGALPSKLKGINHMLDVAKSTSLNYEARSIRKLEYLQQHGMCIDYIKSQKSNIPLAGNGAFANTFLPTGTIVAPMPLVHLFDRSTLAIYEYSKYDDEDEEEEEGDEDEETQTKTERPIVHHQLLLNYCFGHNKSTLLLCPYGYGAGLVNHAGPGYKANVKLVWSQKFTKRSEWLNQTLDEWEYGQYNGLAFEYVAIRDIEENEEILFDYGSDWEYSLYHEHPNEKYIKSIHYMYHLINMYEDNPIELPLYQKQWTQLELQEIISLKSKTSSPVLPPSFTSSAVHVWCRATYLQFQNNNGHHHFTTKEFPNNLTHYPCRIVAKEQSVSFEAATDTLQNRISYSEVLYTAEIYIRDHYLDDKCEYVDYYDDIEDEDCVCSEVPISVAFRLPRDAFAVGNVDNYDKTNPDYPGASMAQYITEPWTFRHEIGIPDDIMPEIWKNVN